MSKGNTVLLLVAIAAEKERRESTCAALNGGGGGQEGRRKYCSVGSIKSNEKECLASSRDNKTMHSCFPPSRRRFASPLCTIDCLKACWVWDQPFYYSGAKGFIYPFASAYKQMIEWLNKVYTITLLNRTLLSIEPVVGQDDADGPSRLLSIKSLQQQKKQT